MYNYIDEAIRTCYLDPKTAKFVIAKMNWDVNQLKHQYENNNQVKSPKVFLPNFVSFANGDCQICYEDAELITTTCKHNACIPCLNNYLRIQIIDENAYPITCFGNKCKGIISESIMNIALEIDKNTLRKYKEAELRQFLEVRY